MATNIWDEVIGWLNPRKPPQLSEKAKKVIARDPEKFQRLYQQVTGQQYVPPLQGLQRIGLGQTPEQQAYAQAVQDKAFAQRQAETRKAVETIKGIPKAMEGFPEAAKEYGQTWLKRAERPTKPWEYAMPQAKGAGLAVDLISDLTKGWGEAVSPFIAGEKRRELSEPYEDWKERTEFAKLPFKSPFTGKQAKIGGEAVEWLTPDLLVGLPFGKAGKAGKIAKLTPEMEKWAISIFKERGPRAAQQVFEELARHVPKEEAVKFVDDIVKGVKGAVVPTGEMAAAGKVAPKVEQVIPKAEQVAAGGIIPPTKPPTTVTPTPPVPPKGKPLSQYPKVQKFNQYWESTRQAPTKAPIKEKLAEVTSNFEKQIVDEAAKLNKLGKPVEESIALFRGMSRKAESLYNETFRTIRSVLGKGSEKLLEEVDRYLFLKHNLEVIKMKGLPRSYVTIDGTRYTAPDLGMALGDMEQRIGVEAYQRVKKAAEAVPAVYNKLLRESSELAPNVIEDLIKKYPYYNPLIYDTESSFVKKGIQRLGRTIRELAEVAPSDTPKNPLSVLGSKIAYRVKNNAENIVRQNIADSILAKKGGKLVDEQPADAFVEFFTNGEKKYIELTDEFKWVADELDFFAYDPGLLDKVTRIGQLINALPRAFYTTLSPVFMLRNLAVDGLTAFLHEGLTPVGYLKGLGRTLKSIVKTDPVFEKMAQAGGAMGGFTAKSSKDVWKQITKTNAGNVLEIKNPNDWKRLLNPAKLIQELGYAVEMAPRVGTFEKVLKEGKTIQEAAVRARRATIDFDRMGEFGRLVNGWYLFANASKEGLLLPFRALRDKPMSRVRIGMFSSLLVGTYAWNRRFPEYEDIPDQVKYGSWVIMLPSDEYNKYGEKVPKYIKITPMLREWGMFAAPFVYLLRKLDGSNPEQVGTFLRTFATNFSPVSNFLGGEGNLYVPTELGQTLTDIGYNFDSFRNKPIVDDDLIDKPKSEQYDEYTSGTAIKLGHILNQSPKIIDYFLNNMTGTLGRELIAALDHGVRAIDSEDSNTRIAGLADQLRDIQVKYKNNPNKIPDARKEFLDKLPYADRQAVLSIERMPEDRIPIVNGIVSSFFRNKGSGGQIYRTEKEKITPEYTQFKYDSEEVFENYYDQKEGDPRANYRTKNPESDAILFLYGKVGTFKTTKAKQIAQKYYEMYGKFDYEMRNPSEVATQKFTSKWSPPEFERSRIPLSTEKRIPLSTEKRIPLTPMK